MNSTWITIQYYTSFCLPPAIIALGCTVSSFFSFKYSCCYLYLSLYKSPILVELIFWNNSGPTFCCILWLTLMFTSTFSAIFTGNSTFFVFVFVSICKRHWLAEDSVPGPLGYVLLFMDEALLICLFEKFQGWGCHSLFVERSGLFVVWAVRLVVGFEIRHFYCSQGFICNFLFLSILPILALIFCQYVFKI